jgi:hypothetical protein
VTAHRQLERLDAAMGFGEFCSCQTSSYAAILPSECRSEGLFSVVANVLTVLRSLLYGSVSNPKTQGLVLKFNLKTKVLRVFILKIFK